MMQIQNKLHSQRGVTLAELLVVMCLLAVLMGFFLQSFGFVLSQFQYRMALMELEDNLSLAAEWIASDGANSARVDACQKESLILQCFDGAVTYTIDSDPQAKEHFYNLTGKILYRRESTQRNRQPMANFISEFRITYYDACGIETEDADCVALVEVLLKGQWNAAKAEKRQWIRLKDTAYL